MIVVTGAAGFIGSVFVGYLNERGVRDLVLVDDFAHARRLAHLRGRDYTRRVDREALGAFLAGLDEPPSAVVHLGAHTDTAEVDVALFRRLNLESSQQLWRYCAEHGVAFLYASSASTYGGGEWGYRDDHALVPQLRPLNAYARSKQAFDTWALAQTQAPPFWAGLKFFNVYGPNEGHKSHMASVVLHAFEQIRERGSVRLFRSHRADVADGDQARDFVYVGDVCEVMWWMLSAQPSSGLYNVGTGEARTFSDLARAVFDALDVPYEVDYVDTPPGLRDGYQYYTRAEMGKLRTAGYALPATSLEDGVREYVTHYLMADVAP